MSTGGKFFWNGGAPHRTSKSGHKAASGWPSRPQQSLRAQDNNYNVFGRAGASRKLADKPHPPSAPGFPGKGVGVKKPMSKVGGLDAVPKPNSGKSGAGPKYRGARFNSGEW